MAKKIVTLAELRREVSKKVENNRVALKNKLVELGGRADSNLANLNPIHYQELFNFVKTLS